MFKRITFLFSVFSVLLLGIAGKAFYEQVIMGPVYANKSVENRMKYLNAEEYNRGEILDCNGISLTNSVYKPAIIIFPRLIDNPTRFLNSLKSTLPELDINLKRIQPYYYKGNKIYPEPIVIPIENSLYYLEKIQAFKEQGIAILPYKFRYGKDSLATHIVGFVGYEGKEIKGKKGIEFFLDEELKGSKPERIITAITDARNNLLTGLGYRVVDLGKDEKRKDILLTIDSRVQRIVEDTMDKRGIIKGAVVILNVEDGTILAAASRPNFNQNNPGAGNFDDSLIERVINYKVYPGSIFKVITAAAALEEGIVEPLSIFNCIGNSSFVTCPRPHGNITLIEAMERSCNVYFVQLGLKLGREKLEEYIINRFGFKPVPGKFLDSDPARAHGIIGQEIFKTSPLEIANLMATIARDGYHQEINNPWKTRLIKAIRTQDGKQKNFIELPRFKKLYSYDTSKKLKAMLIATNKWGSGKKAWVEYYGSAGKTGTPEGDKPNEYMAWYAGYAPLNKPKLAVAVLIEKIEGLSKFELQGGKHSAPVFKEVVEKTLKLYSQE